VTSRRLAGKVALVTGAARGRGRSHALILAREGADVMLVDLCDNIPSCDYPLATSEDLDRTACMIEKLNRTVAVYRCDVCDRAEMEVAVDAAVRQLGALDVVVANAAIAPIRPEAPIAAFIDTFDVDFIGVVNTFSAAMPRLSAGASLIASGPTCSPQGPSLDRPQGPGAAAYELAQSMVSQYVKTLAKQVAPQGIRVNTVSGATPSAAPRMPAMCGVPDGCIGPSCSTRILKAIALARRRFQRCYGQRRPGLTLTHPLRWRSWQRTNRER